MQDLYWGLLCVFCLSLGWQAGKHGEQYWRIAKTAGDYQADKIFNKLDKQAFQQDEKKSVESNESPKG